VEEGFVCDSKMYLVATAVILLWRRGSFVVLRCIRWPLQVYCCAFLYVLVYSVLRHTIGMTLLKTSCFVTKTKY